MSDVLSAQHPPALRVGGRRLSISARPKPHLSPSSLSSPATTRLAEDADYPRPGTQGQGDDAETRAPHNEDEAPKKEKKHGHGHDQNKLRESVRCKLDATMPSKDHVAKHSFGGAGRIGQPMGKALAV